MEHWTRKLVGQDFDLTLAYFTMPDKVSHLYWKYWEPDAFESMTAERAAEYRHVIPDAYETVDKAIGRIVDAAPPDALVFVISDHGFRALSKPKIRIQFDFDALLEEIGLLSRDQRGSIDLQGSRLMSHTTHQFKQRKLLRAPRPDDNLDMIRSLLEEELEPVTYESGKPVAEVLSANPEDVKQGGDFVVQIQTAEPTRNLRYRGRTLEGVVRQLTEVSGSHGADDAGIFLAAGPAIAAGTYIEEITIFDMASTLLHAMGLPVAENFTGRPKVAIFEQGFREENPLRTIPRWRIDVGK